MDNNKYWLSIWKTAAVTLCVLIIASVGSCQSSKYQIRKAIEAGATPMEAACAFNHGNVSDGSLCAITLLSSDKEI